MVREYGGRLRPRHGRGSSHINAVLSMFTVDGDVVWRTLHMEETLNGSFDIRIVSKALSGEILLQSQKQMKVTWSEIRTGGWCRCSQPRVAIRFCRRRVWSRIAIQQ
ncbi:hypothetical protein TNCV_1850351 [Trichonephila clavipes]|nr:hypothetical protein TNCV_1850351 [Trichonephila clavipes]